MQANDSRLYMEGDVVNFQCQSGLSPADAVNASCTMEGTWRLDAQLLDPQMLNCSSTTEDTSTTTTIKSIQGMKLF